jgi:hypothetical protein
MPRFISAMLAALRGLADLGADDVVIGLPTGVTF